MAEGGEDTPNYEDPNVPATLRELFGGTILTKETLEPVDIDVINGEGKVVGVYLSGHWCPPCKKFTPLLCEWYEKFKQNSPNADNFEIIFLSSDRNDMEFTRYFMTMPWFAVPFDESERRTMITNRYHLKGIPVLLLLKASSCELISADGRGIVTEDVDAVDFPWDPEPITKTLEGPVLDKDGEEIPFDSISKGKTIGIYFHALWSEPCTEFIGKLTSVYEKLKDAKNFEVIFSSSDQTEEDFTESYALMPWYTIPYNDRRRKKSARILQVEGVPTLVIVGPDGEIISYDANVDVSKDPEGKDFPWYPKPVSEMVSDSMDVINEFPCILWFTANDENEMAKANKAMEPVSMDYHKTIDINDARNTCQLIHFFYGGHNKDEGDDETVGEQLRDFAELPNKTPLLVLLDIQNQTKYVCAKSKITTEVVSNFLEGYKNGTLPKEALEL